MTHTSFVCDAQLIIIYCSEFDDGLVSLASFTADLIYKAVLACVEAIKMATCDIPRSLPPGMSQKFRAGSALANAITVSRVYIAKS